MHIAGTANRECLFNRLEQAITLIAHVGGIERIKGLCASRQFNDLVRQTETTGTINETGRKSARALLQCPADVRLHVSQFRRQRLARSIAHDE